MFTKRFLKEHLGFLKYNEADLDRDRAEIDRTLPRRPVVSDTSPSEFIWILIGSNGLLKIVKETDKRFLERVKDVVKICDYDIGVDFLIYTPQELNEAGKVNPFVRDEIVSKGKVVYRAA
jgi:hypothetical protein